MKKNIQVVPKRTEGGSFTRISHRKTLRVECVQNHQPTHSPNNFLCTPLNHFALWCSGSGWLYFHSVLLLRFRATPPLSQWGIGNGRVGVYSIYPVLDEPITFPDFTSLLCFSTVYIVGSWTSKLPSTTATTAATATTTDTTATSFVQDSPKRNVDLRAAESDSG